MNSSDGVIGADAFKCYMTGIGQVDKQHWDLVVFETEINNLACGGKKLEAYAKIPELRIALLKHFKDEENLMIKIGFPFLEAHKEDHWKIVVLLDNVYKIFLERDYDKECFAPIYSLMHSHLDQMDFQVVPYYQKWAQDNEVSSGES